MANIPKYSFIIKDFDGNQYEFENCTSRAWEHYENDVGRCRFFIPHNDLKLSTTSVPDDRYSEIMIFRNGSLVWQGVVQIIQDTPDGVWVYGETFEAALAWYGCRYNQEYTSSNISTIIEGEYDNIASRSNNFLNAKITKGTIENPYIQNTSNNLTITRTLFHENFLIFLKQMVLTARAEATASWNQNTVFGISFSETAPTFTFQRNVGSDKNDVVFELDSEIVDYNVPGDFRGIASYVKGLAIASGPVILNDVETDTSVQGNWYRREFYPYFNNVTAQDDLNKRTANFLYDRNDTKRNMKIKLAAGLVPFDGYSMGDNIIVRINKGRINSNEQRRVVGMEVNIEDTGIERVTPVLQKLRD